MMEGIGRGSPRLKARVASVFYLLNIVTGGLAAVFIARKLVGYGNAVTLVAAGCYVVVTLLFYHLFRPVSRRISLLAALFSLVGCAVGALSALPLPSFPINSLVFFGFYCVLIGYLIIRSTFLPRILGVLMAVAGLGWLTFLSPALAHALSPYNLLPGVFGEGALTLWLLAVGLNAERWQEQAG